MKNNNISRLLTIKETSEYIRVGINNTRKLMDEIGATVHVGKRVLADRHIIDSYIDNVRGTKTNQ